MPTPRGCWSSEAKQDELRRAAGAGQLHPAAAHSGVACGCARSVPGHRQLQPAVPAQLAGADPTERDPAHTRAGRPGHGRLPGQELDRHLERGPGRREDGAGRARRLEYGQALLDERDLTAPRRCCPSEPPERPRRHHAYATTDDAKKKFDKAVQHMPEKHGLERRLEPLPGGGARARRAPQGRLHQARGSAVETEEGYVKVQHSLMEFSNELGLGTGNITSLRPYRLRDSARQGRRVAPALHRHAPAGPAQPGRHEPRKAAHRVRLVQLPGADRPRRVHLRRCAGGRRAARAIMAAKAKRGRQAARGRQAEAAPPTSNGSVRRPHGQPRSARGRPQNEEGITPETWMAAATAKFDGYRPSRRSSSTRPWPRPPRSPPTPARRHHQRRDRGRRAAGRLHHRRPDGPLDEPHHAPAAHRRLRRRRAAAADAGRPALAYRPRPGRHPRPADPASPAGTRSARWPGPSTRSTAKPYGSPPSRRMLRATSTRSSSTSRAATSA